ncbi:MAG: methyl-accepting chemotaxis protein [Methylophagaceae bacterium]|jgi:methyl-accepting chemotaxis protein
MLKLENYSLKRRMQFVAIIGVIGLFSSTAVYLYLAKSGMTLADQGVIGLIFTVVVSAGLYICATMIGNFGSTRANVLVDGIQNIKKGDLSKKIAISGKSDFSWMAFELDSARKNISALVHTIVGGVAQLETASKNMAAISKETVDGVLTQQSETTQVATAMNEMAASVQEVAKTAENTAEAARNAEHEAQAGKKIVNETMGSISSLAQEVEKAAETLNNLETDIANIGAIVDVIRSITEQTNLLALNAAIEAARAGEHGRGFAVVADEVRTLAARTQSSTHEIEEMVGRLQVGALAAVTVMNEGRESAKNSVDKAANAASALDSMVVMIGKMDEMSAAISSAANEQATVAEDINRGIVNISQVAELTAEGANQTSDAVATMTSLSEQLQQAAGKFKV